MVLTFGFSFVSPCTPQEKMAVIVGVGQKQSMTVKAVPNLEMLSFLTPEEIPEAISARVEMWPRTLTLQAENTENPVLSVHF